MKDFKITYKRAYEHITPNPDYLDGIADRLEEKYKKRQQLFILMMRPVATACVVMIILSMTALPVIAKSVPAIYTIIEKYAPALVDFVLPVEISDTSQGITMQVEAVNVEDQNAEIVVSFTDTEGSGKNLIKGKVDMYDSYHLQSYGASYNVGGCNFLEYDETEDKAYFKIQLLTDGEYNKGKMQFKVRQLLTNYSEEKKWINLDNIVMNPTTKAVSLSGGAGNRKELSQYFGKGTEEDPRPRAQVMNHRKADTNMKENLTVMGVGFSDGVLRIQTCRGNFENADRHMNPFLVDSQGKERCSDYSVDWHEEVNGERLMFTEHWFLVEQSELEKIQIYGIFYITDGNVEGDWEVICEVE